MKINYNTKSAIPAFKMAQVHEVHMVSGPNKKSIGDLS
jgi:hypothetical protein